MNAPDNRVVFLTNVRLSYPALALPQEMKRDSGEVDKVYGASFLLDKEDPQFTKFLGRCEEVLREAWKENAPMAIQMIWADRKSRCFSSGEEHVNSKTMTVKEGYAGKYVISASSGDRQPQAVDGTGQIIDPANSMAVTAAFRKMYGGCRVNVALRPWAQMPSARNKNTKGIRCDLVAVQFLRDDTAFGEAAPDVSGLFGVVEQPAQVPTMGGFGQAPQGQPAIAPPPSFAPMPQAQPAPAAPTFGTPVPGLPTMPAFPGAR